MVVVQFTGKHRTPLPDLSEIVESNGKLFADGTLVIGNPVPQGLKSLAVPFGTNRERIIDYVRGLRIPDGTNAYLLGEATIADKKRSEYDAALQFLGVSISPMRTIEVYPIQFYAVTKAD